MHPSGSNLRLLIPAAQADTTRWTASGGGDWFSGTNWDNGIPALSLDAFVNNGGTPKINGFQARAQTLTLGAAESESGSLEVDGTDGGFLAVGPCGFCDGSSPEGSLYVGRGGSGTFSITNGGIVTSPGFAYIALEGDGTPGSVSSNGSVTVDGANSTWTVNGGRLFVGGNSGGTPGGTALLSVTNGGEVIVNNQFAAVPAGLPVGISGTLASISI